MFSQTRLEFYKFKKNIALLFMLSHVTAGFIFMTDLEIDYACSTSYCDSYALLPWQVVAGDGQCFFLELDWSNQS